MLLERPEGVRRDLNHNYSVHHHDDQTMCGTFAFLYFHWAIYVSFRCMATHKVLQVVRHEGARKI